MPELKRVCVFCGSSTGTLPSFAAAAVSLGTTLAERHIELVYGGASIGLMGVIADAALAAGGRVTGVITESLSDHEIAHGGLARLDVVRTMDERKTRMAELSEPSSCCRGASVPSRNSWRPSRGANSPSMRSRAES